MIQAYNWQRFHNDMNKDFINFISQFFLSSDIIMIIFSFYKEKYVKKM